MDRASLEDLYLNKRLSAQEIAQRLECSANKINYWITKHGIQKRTISEAIYQRHNPNGDPFLVRPIKSRADAMLVGMGLGLYWGEGTKSNKHAVRLGNTDPALLNKFILFLTDICGVDKEQLRFGLQIFTDIDNEEALSYWIHELGVKRSQFYKTIVTISGSLGTYRKKSLYGVVTVHFNNKKLRDIIVGMLPR